MAETGHAPNVARFAKLISFCTGYGADYNPSNADISLVALNSTLTAAQSAMDNVTNMMGPWKIAVDNRSDAFLGIRKLVTRVVNSFAASGATESMVDDAKGFKRKIDGARAKALEDDPATPEDETAGGISVSQRSYPQLVEHLDDLIELLESAGVYAPNETDLTIASLKGYSTSLKAANAAVVAVFTPFSNARIARDAVLYNEPLSLVNLAALVKKYVKSVYGGDSPQFEQISGLEFTRPR